MTVSVWGPESKLGTWPLSGSGLPPSDTMARTSAPAAVPGLRVRGAAAPTSSVTVKLCTRGEGGRCCHLSPTCSRPRNQAGPPKPD